MTHPPKPVTPKSDMVYTAILEGKEEGRDQFGWYLGIAKRGERGYHQLKPGFGPYSTQQAARDHAMELNRTLGHDEKSALLIVLGTMSGRR